MKGGDNVSEKFYQLLSECFELEQINRAKSLEKYPTDVPNSKCLLYIIAKYKTTFLGIVCL